MCSCPYTRIDLVMGKTVEKTDCGISLGEAMITDLGFAEDIVTLTEMLELLMGALSTESESHGLVVF